MSEWCLLVRNTFINVETEVQTAITQRMSTDPEEYCKTKHGHCEGSWSHRQVSESANHGDTPPEIESTVEFKLEDDPELEEAAGSTNNLNQTSMQRSWEQVERDQLTGGVAELEAQNVKTESSQSPTSSFGSCSTQCSTADQDTETEDACDSKSRPIDEDKRTTVMIRNLPNNMSRDSLAKLLRVSSCHQYDFLYLPCDLHRLTGLGYAFVNFVTHDAAKHAIERLEGYTSWSDVEETFTSTKTCSVSWGREDQQGLQWQIEKYRNSPLMHDRIPDVCRPAIFRHGELVPFPPPTKRVRLPRLKPCRPK